MLYLDGFDIFTIAHGQPIWEGSGKEEVGHPEDRLAAVGAGLAGETGLAHPAGGAQLWIGSFSWHPFPETWVLRGIMWEGFAKQIGLYLFWPAFTYLCGCDKCFFLQQKVSKLKQLQFTLFGIYSICYSINDIMWYLYHFAFVIFTPMLFVTRMSYWASVWQVLMIL